MLIKYNCLYFFFLAQFGFFLFELSNTVCFSFLYPLCNILHVNNNNTFFSSLSFPASFMLFSSLTAIGVFLFWFLCSPFSIKGCIFFFISFLTSAGSTPTLLWYQSSSFEELCCVLCLPSFLHLYTYFLYLHSFLVLSFSNMGEER